MEKKGLEKWKDKHDESVNLFRAGLVLVNYWCRSDPFSPLLCCSWCSIQQAGKMLLACRHLISIWLPHSSFSSVLLIFLPFHLPFSVSYIKETLCLFSGWLIDRFAARFTLLKSSVRFNSLFWTFPFWFHLKACCFLRNGMICPSVTLFLKSPIFRRFYLLVVGWKLFILARKSTNTYFTKLHSNTPGFNMPQKRFNEQQLKSSLNVFSN